MYLYVDGKDNFTPLHEASEHWTFHFHDSENIHDLDGSGNSPLRNASQFIMFSDYNLAKMLLTHGVYVNAKGRHRTSFYGNHHLHGIYLPTKVVTLVGYSQ